MAHISHKHLTDDRFNDIEYISKYDKIQIQPTTTATTTDTTLLENNHHDTTTIHINGTNDPNDTSNNNILQSDDKKLLLLLCLVTFFLAFKPSEPFLTAYLIEHKNIDEYTVNHSIYPVYIYAYTIAMLPVGISSYYIGYKRMIMMCILMREATRLLLIYGTSLLSMQLMQITFGIAEIDGIIMISYIYTLLPVSAYTKATGYYNASLFLGHVAAGLVGQLLVSLSYNYTLLFWISFIHVTIGFILFVFLPDDKNINLQHTPYNDEDERIHAHTYIDSHTHSALNDTRRRTDLSPLKQYIYQIYRHYTCNDGYILRWSLWWMLCKGIVDLSMNYILSLYYEVDDSVNYQGISDTLARVSGALFSMAPIYLTTPRSSPIRWCTVSAILCSILLFLTSQSPSIYICYLTFCLFYGIMSFTWTQVSASIGSHLEISFFAILFTINTFITVCIESFIQYMIDSVMHLSARDTFVTFAIHMIIASAIISFTGLIIYLRQRSRTQFTILEQHHDQYQNQSMSMGMKNHHDDRSSMLENGDSYDK